MVGWLVTRDPIWPTTRYWLNDLTRLSDGETSIYILATRCGSVCSPSPKLLFKAWAYERGSVRAVVNSRAKTRVLNYKQRAFAQTSCDCLSSVWNERLSALLNLLSVSMLYIRQTQSVVCLPHAAGSWCSCRLLRKRRWRARVDKYIKLWTLYRRADQEAKEEKLATRENVYISAPQRDSGVKHRGDSYWDLLRRMLLLLLYLVLNAAGGLEGVIYNSSK